MIPISGLSLKENCHQSCVSSINIETSAVTIITGLGQGYSIGRILRASSSIMDSNEKPSNWERNLAFQGAIKEAR